MRFSQGLFVIASCLVHLSALADVVYDVPEFGDVRNGSAYDLAQIEISEANVVIVPASATIEIHSELDSLLVRMTKRLAFFGFPPEPMDIAIARSNFGIATRHESDSLVVATFGEWASPEGGASIELHVSVPEHLQVQTRTGLTGAGSSATAPVQFNESGIDSTSSGYWYVSGLPADGWAKVQDEPAAVP